MLVFVKSMVLSFFANPTKRPTGVRKKNKKRGGDNRAALLEALAQRFIYGLVKTMFASEGSKPAESEAQGEGRERVLLI